jgi:hypothetical protein
MSVACVNCKLTSRVAAYFDLDFDLSDLARLNDPFNTARIGLKVLDAIDGNFSIEAAAAVNVQVQCAYPDTCLKGSKGRGKKFRRRTSRNGNATTVIASDILEIHLLIAQRSLVCHWIRT